MADLESMEEIGTPIRIDIDKHFDQNAIYLRLEEDEAKWTAKIDESLPVFELGDRMILDSNRNRGWHYWGVASDSIQSSRIIFEEEGLFGRTIDINLEFY